MDAVIDMFAREVDGDGSEASPTRSDESRPTHARPAVPGRVPGTRRLPGPAAPPLSRAAGDPGDS